MAYDRDVPADSPAIARILAVVNDADSSSAALGLLMRSPVSESLGRCLSHDDVAVRRGAARMLFEFDRDAPSADTTRDAVRYLEVALKDKDHEVRLYCLLSLAKNTEASVGIFHSFLGDEDPLIQAAALK